LGQSLSNVLLHIIFSTKNRQLFIDDDIIPELYAYIISISASKGSYAHKIGGMSDHIHLLITLPRILSICDLLEELKKNSSKWIKLKGKKYKNFAWQKGYGVFSVSESQHNAVAKYIMNQREHHKTKSFQDEYREFLKLNKIPFDEKYIWE